jgi:hypothetical protein
VLLARFVSALAPVGLIVARMLAAPDAASAATGIGTITACVCPPPAILRLTVAVPMRSHTGPFLSSSVTVVDPDAIVAPLFITITARLVVLPVGMVAGSSPMTHVRSTANINLGSRPFTSGRPAGRCVLPCMVMLIWSEIRQGLPAHNPGGSVRVSVTCFRDWASTFDQVAGENQPAGRSPANPAPQGYSIGWRPSGASIKCISAWGNVRVFGLFGAPTGLGSSANADRDKLRKMGKRFSVPFRQLPDDFRRFLPPFAPSKPHFLALFEIY